MSYKTFIVPKHKRHKIYECYSTWMLCDAYVL